MQTLPNIVKQKDYFKLFSRNVRYMVLGRLSKCDTCVNKRQRTAGGNILATPINNPTNVYQCGIIGCALVSFLSDPEHGCPAADPHWLPILNNNAYETPRIDQATGH